MFTSVTACGPGLLLLYFASVRQVFILISVTFEESALISGITVYLAAVIVGLANFSWMDPGKSQARIADMQPTRARL